MKVKEPPTAGGTPPPPIDPALPALDEGPMRGDLRRQIQELESALNRLKIAAFPWETIESSPRRGPQLLAAEDLERVRDELVAVLTSLEHRLAAQQVAGLATEPELRPRGLRVRLAELARRVAGR